MRDRRGPMGCPGMDIVKAMVVVAGTMPIMMMVVVGAMGLM